MRKYSASKSVPPIPLRTAQAAPIPSSDLRSWEDGQLLHDLKGASAILTAKLGSGYSYDELRLMISSGQLQEKVHYFKKGRRYKVNLHRIIEWQLGN